MKSLTNIVLHSYLGNQIEMGNKLSHQNLLEKKNSEKRILTKTYQLFWKKDLDIHGFIVSVNKLQPKALME